MKKLLIILGGVAELSFLKEYYDKMQPDMVIAADGALEAAKKADIPCDVAMGDFDTVSQELLEQCMREKKVKLITFPPEKDETDAQLTLQYAIDQKPDMIRILGALGGRADHMLANLELLKLPLKAGIDCEIVDRQNRIRLLDGEYTIKKSDSWKYVSFVSYTEKTEGLILEGFKYPLDNFTLKKGSPRCISNEITSDMARISFDSGMLYCICSRD